MNKKLIVLIINLLIFLLIILNSTFLKGIVTAQLTEMEAVAENKYLILYLNKNDTSIALQCKDNDQIWFSNPEGRQRERDDLRYRLSSQLNIIHDPNSVQKNNYRFSTRYNQFKVSSIPEGVRVDYTFVEEWRAAYYLPKLISKNSFDNNIANKIGNESELAALLDAYHLIKMVPLENKGRINIRGLDKEKVFGEYTIQILDSDYQKRLTIVEDLKQDLSQLKEIRDNNNENNSEEKLQSRKKEIESTIAEQKAILTRNKSDLIFYLLELIKDNRLDIDRVEQITYDDLSQLVMTPTYVQKRMAPFIREELAAILESVGYTPIAAGQDHELNNLDPQIANLQIFTVPVEYNLERRDLLVTIPTAEIDYPIAVEDSAGRKHTYPLRYIDVLPYFSAAGLDETGYIFVPDGSGALIYLNNDKTYAASYNEPVYGRDLALDPEREKNMETKQIHLPVFGLKTDNQAFLAIIEKGESLARIRADVAGRTDNYNRVFAQFTYLPRGIIDIEGAGYIYNYQSRATQEDFQLRYKFLSDAQANYSGMARTYQEYLVGKYDLKQLEAGEFPFILEVVGSFPKIESWLGIPGERVYPFTTFAQTAKIVEGFNEKGINNLHLRYRGWLKGGLTHYYPQKVVLEKRLGEEEKLNDLINYTSTNKTMLFPDVGFLNVYQNNLFDGFNFQKDTSRHLNRLIVHNYNYDLDTNRINRDKYNYVLSPARLDQLLDSFLEDFTRYDFNAISLTHMGYQLNSDFRETEELLIDREQAKDLIIKQLKKINEIENLEIMLAGGNVYTLPYISTLVEMPLESSLYDITDRSIPFMQMVVNGYLNYAGGPLNLEDNYKNNLLLMLETGAIPYFILGYEQSSVVKETDFAYLYSVNYEEWIDTATAIYNEAADLLAELHNLRIISHEKITENVFKTSYENNKAVVVNYNKHSVELGNDMTIKGESYLLIEEEEE